MILLKHFLITRFNLRRNWGGIEEYSAGITGEWLAKRFKIFTDYTLPSVAGQTCLNFTWLIYFDDLTTEFYKNKIYEMEIQYPFFKPRFIDGYRVFRSTLNSDVAALKEDAAYIITSRIDNDDCFHKEAMAKIQGSFTETNYQPVNFKKGYCYNIKNGHLTAYSDNSNPFISLVEKIETGIDIKTVFCREHQHYRQHDTIKQISNKAYWLQIIHGDNISNRLLGRPSYNYINLANFCIDKDFIKIQFYKYFKTFLKFYFSKLTKKIKFI